METAWQIVQRAPIDPESAALFIFWLLDRADPETGSLKITNKLAAQKINKSRTSAWRMFKFCEQVGIIKVVSEVVSEPVSEYRVNFEKIREMLFQKLFQNLFQEKVQVANVVSPFSACDQAKKPQKESTTAKKKGRSVPVWQAYISAYGERYKDELGKPIVPPRGAKDNALCCSLVDRLSLEDAVAVVRFYLKANDQLYLFKKHPLELCSLNLTKLLNEMKSGKTTTLMQARDAELYDHNSRVVEEYLRKKYRNVPQEEEKNVNCGW